MNKLRILFSLAVVSCSPAMSQLVNDAPGVSVELNGAAVLHRAGVTYPPEALRNGVQGAVSLQLKLDSAGEVADAQVLSGPEGLRKAALQSVLQWHFAQDVAGTTRSVQIAFEIPKSSTKPAPPSPPVPATQTGTVRSIRVLGLSDQASADLLASLPIHEGAEWNSDTATKVDQTLKAFDEHLISRSSSMTQSPDGSTQLDFLISAGVQRISVGGNVQGAMVLRKVPPVYPADAKAAGIQGVVHLSATIGMDGTVQALTVLDGPPELVQAATDAVKQWIYRPTLLNGNPVQVQTTIDINFTLSK